MCEAQKGYTQAVDVIVNVVSRRAHREREGDTEKPSTGLYSGLLSPLSLWRSPCVRDCESPTKLSQRVNEPL